MQGLSIPPTPVSTREHFLVCLNRLCVCLCLRGISEYPKISRVHRWKPSFPASPHFCLLLGGDWGTAELCSEGAGSISKPSSLGGGGLVKPPAGQKGGLNSTSHPLGLGTSLDSKESTKEKKKSTGSHNHPGGSRPLWDIIEFNNLFISNLCDKLVTPTE